MRFIAYVLALLAGAALSFEGAIYGVLGESIGELETSFYNFFMGTVIMGFIWLFFGKGKLSSVMQAPKWSLAGGGLGVIYLTALVISVPSVVVFR